MLGKKIGEPCPCCSAALIRRPSRSMFRAALGDIAFCARCNAAWEIAEEEPALPALGLPGLTPRPVGA